MLGAFANRQSSGRMTHSSSAGRRCATPIPQLSVAAGPSVPGTVLRTTSISNTSNTDGAASAPHALPIVLIKLSPSLSSQRKCGRVARKSCVSARFMKHTCSHQVCGGSENFRFVGLRLVLHGFASSVTSLGEIFTVQCAAPEFHRIANRIYMLEYWWHTTLACMQ